MGYIIKLSDTTMVLGVKNDNFAAGTEVIQEKFTINDYGQQWEIGFEDDTGYFTIKNPESEKFLSFKNNKLTIEGMLNVSLLSLIYFRLSTDVYFYRT